MESGDGYHLIVVLRRSDLEKEAKEFEALSEEEFKRPAIEHRTIRVTQTELPVLDEKLNKLETKRWDCYEVSEGGQGRVFYLKRRESDTLCYITDLLRRGWDSLSPSK